MSDKTLYGYQNTIEVSTDGGTTWKIVGEWDKAAIKIASTMLDRTTTKTVGDDITGGATGAWKHQRPSVKSWTAQCSGLRVFDDTGIAALRTAILTDQQIKMRFHPAGTGTGKEELTGLGYVNGDDINFDNLQLDTDAFTVEGDGPLTETTLP